MSQILDSIPDKDNSSFVMCYVNATSSIQVARITNIPNWYFERVVFPGQRLIFEAPLEAYLEIHTGMMASAILSDKIPCKRLVLEDEEVPASPSPKAQQVIEYRNENPDAPTPEISNIPKI
ncbi:MAG: DUF1830 domain-containing protein [Acaryochloridaceae cyanobacterium RL_2_7]|nr:DUF1830 domain-containing protein [Acaryochloridaceae cyanobacterium RL_2_7]